MKARKNGLGSAGRVAEAPRGFDPGHTAQGARVTGSIRIAAPPERVFAVVADSRNEPSFNPAMTEVDTDATVVVWDWRVRPQGWFRALGPLVGPMGRRMERRSWTGLKRRLEAEVETRRS